MKYFILTTGVYFGVFIPKYPELQNQNPIFWIYIRRIMNMSEKSQYRNCEREKKKSTAVSL